MWPCRKKNRNRLIISGGRQRENRFALDSRIRTGCERAKDIHSTGTCFSQRSNGGNLSFGRHSAAHGDLGQFRLEFAQPKTCCEFDKEIERCSACFSLEHVTSSVRKDRRHVSGICNALALVIQSLQMLCPLPGI